MEDNKELEGEFYTLTDEDGHEIQFEVIGSAVLNDKTYYAMVPTEDQPEDDEVCEYVILRADQDENGEDILVTVDDDEEFEDVICCRMRRITTSIRRRSSPERSKS